MPNQSGAVDLGRPPTAEEQEKLREMAEEHPEDGQTLPVVFAVTLALTHDGDFQMFEFGAPLKPAGAPSNDLIYGACAAVMKDLTAMETAQATLQAQIQQARAMQEQMQAAQVASKLGNLRG